MLLFTCSPAGCRLVIFECEKAGFLTRSQPIAPSHPCIVGQWLSAMVLTGTYSSGYCHGFSPCSLHDITVVLS